MSTLLHILVHNKICSVFQARVSQPLVLRRHSMRLHPRKSTRPTQCVGEIPSPVRMCKRIRRRRPGCNRLVGRITDLRNTQANVNKTINIALAQSGVMGVDRACALAGQVITNVKGPYLFYRSNVKTKKLTPLTVSVLCRPCGKKITYPYMVH